MAALSREKIVSTTSRKYYLNDVVFYLNGFIPDDRFWGKHGRGR